MLRDVSQFGVMLILVRLISPTEYGVAMLAQSIVGFIGVASFVALSAHALQLRDPKKIDWQAHFTAGVVVNSALFAVTLIIAFVLSRIPHLQATALPLSIAALSFLLDIPAALRQRMVQVNHDWMRFRTLTMIGTLLGHASALVIVAAGGGVWALIIQPLAFGLPATIDLFWNVKWRPDWSWSWSRYRDTASFASSRVTVGLLSTGRGMVEQTTMAGIYDFATLGVFSRAVGLATMAAGRVGTVALSSIYPVITRAEKGSDQFRRYAGLVLTSVCWATICGATFVALASADLVALLYGPTWREVAPLLPIAAISVAANGILAAITTLLLANDEVRACFWIDVLTTGLGVVVALLLIPKGAATYLAWVAALSLALVALAGSVLRRRNAIEAAGVIKAFAPALVAGAVAIIAVLAIRRTMGTSSYLPVRLAIDGFVVVLAYVLTLRVAFAGPFAEVAAVILGRRWRERPQFLRWLPSGRG